MKRILVVEDDLKIQEIIVEVLKDANEEYELVSASDGLEGMMRFIEQEYELVITDIMMPHLDGYELVKRIREKDANVNIIMLTALNEEYDEIRGFELGINDYISKPFSTRLLVKRVEEQLKKTKNTKVKDELLDLFKK